ncbi:UDP-xylose transporter 1 [Citrus sinensis]|nr:UDP-xylose transporter 1 [Citrus sinensis]
MVTFCTLHAAQRLNFFESKAVDVKTVMLFGILNGISIGLLNLSLGFNSVGFYQMTKLAIIPFTVLLETLFLKKQFSQKIKFSLFLLLVGVGIASVTDLQLNMVGTILSLLAIVTTCVGQIAFIILSCLIAVSVNFSTFLVIGKTSPVTYQVLGHLKTCLVLGFGYTLLHDPFTERNIIGILVAICGMGLYSYFCAQENKKKQSGDLSLSSQMKDHKETAALLAHHQEKEGHEVKKAAKDSIV